MTKQDQELYTMLQEFDTFNKFVDLMEERNATAINAKCPNCDEYSLVPISLTHSECSNCKTITEI